MHLAKFGLFLTVCLIVSSYAVFAQEGEEKDGMPGWEVICVDNVKEGVVIQCPGFENAGFNYWITRELIVNTDVGMTGIRLKITKLLDDRRRSLKIVEVKPARDEDDPNQEYWFSNSFSGPGGEELKSYFVGFNFHCKNMNNSGNGRGGYCADGDYSGTLKFRESISTGPVPTLGPVQTLTLNVTVKTIKDKK